MPNQQHRISLGIRMVKAAAAAIDPAAIQHGEEVSGIAIDFQGVRGIR